MTLATYHQKRQFSQTPEPRGRAGRKAGRQLAFVIQKHDASRLHYDFRLEWDGVLKSWAVPKGPSLDPARKALAVQVEDHPIEYGDFEGVIPKGQYGGGTVLLWDRGTWEPLHDPEAGLADGKLHFILHGKKLHGEWSLVRMHGPSGGNGKNWLLMKINDRYASTTRDILAAAPESVKSRRNMEKIAGDRDDVWSSNARPNGKNSPGWHAPIPKKLAPQLAVLAEHPPAGDQWIHEIKFDGYRLLAFVKAGAVTLQTRNGLDWTAKFPGIAAAMAKLKVDSAIVDGEAVVLDSQGRSDFQALQTSLKDPSGSGPVFFAFDLPYCDGIDLRESPLMQRKKMLKKILRESRVKPRINFSDHIRGDGSAVIKKACGMSLEGIISKRIDAPYVSRRDPSWLKSKCGNRQEFVIIGYTEPKKSRSGFGSIVLGYHDDKGRLVYAGRVGAGFDEAMLRQMIRKLREIEREKPATDVPPPPRERRATHWVEPKLVAEVRFFTWTRDGMLRHPVFVALRSDKPAAQIVREKPAPPGDKAHSNDHKKSPAARGRASVAHADGGTEIDAAHDAEPESEAAPESGGSTNRRELNRSSADSRATDASVAGVNLTHPDKLLFSDAKVSKRQLAEYYKSVKEWILPHIVDRPLALVRCPDGTAGKCFFQRNWSPTMPAAVEKVDVRAARSKEQHVAVNNIAGVISLVQIGILEIHTWNCRAGNIEHPDQLIFDLDPGPDVSWKHVVAGARKLKDMLESLKLPAFLKTSGGKGLHITIPIEPNIDWDSAKSFCKTIAAAMVEQSDMFVANMRKELRGGKIYIDFNRNGKFATAVAPYSTRRAAAPVSMPITWEELGRLKSAAQFTLTSVERYLARRSNDPWARFEKSRVDLRKIVNKVRLPEE